MPKHVIEKLQQNIWLKMLSLLIGIFTFLITATITLVTYRRSKAYNEEDTFQ